MKVMVIFIIPGETTSQKLRLYDWASDGEKKRLYDWASGGEKKKVEGA